MQVAGAEVLVAETIRRLGRANRACRAVPGRRRSARGADALGRCGRRRARPAARLDWRVSRRMAAAIDQHQLDVVHAHQYHAVLLHGAGQAFVAPVHVMFTEHGRHYPDVVSARRRLANRLVLTRFADEITA